MDENIIENKENSTQNTEKKTKFSLKNENEDNLIENDSKEEKEFLNNSKESPKTMKYKIKYTEILKKLRANDKEEDNYENECSCNILLMPSIINFSDKLSTLSMISYCYQVRKNCNLIFSINHKFEKNLKYINDFDANFFLNVFGRTAFFMKEEQNCFYALKYIEKCSDLIKENSSKFKNSKKEKISEYLKEMNENLLNYIKSKEVQFKDKELMSKEKCTEIKELINLIITNKNNIDLNDGDNNYIYAINKNWITKVKIFIEPYIINFEDNDKYIKDVFDPIYVYKSYFDEKIEKNIKYTFPYPGPINNFPLISFKDFWEDKENLDENVFLKNNIELNNDYCLVNHKDWELLKSVFDCTNEIKRKKDNLDLIKIKFIVFDKRISNSNHNINLLKLKYIQINKNSTVGQLKNKIINCVNDELKFFNSSKKKKNKSISISFFTLKKDKKDIIIEMIFAFKYGIQMYESLYIEKIEFQDDNTLNDFFIKYDKKKDILIVEINKKDDCNFLVQMDNNYKCNICGKEIKNLKEKYNCDICNFSLFCSHKCSRSSNEHLCIDNKLKEIMEEKFVLQDLLSFDLTSILYKGQNIGRVGLNNLGNTCYMNSVLQCLSNTRDLTKYFLRESFKKEINNANYFGSKGDISQAYYELIKLMYVSNGDEYINTKKFRVVFCNRTKLFTSQEQYDAHEFLSALLDNLHEDLNRITHKNYMELEEQKKGESDEIASKRWWDYYKSRDDSIIVDLFKGQFKTTITCCECNHKSVNFDTFMTLDLPIPQKKTQIQFKLFTNSGNYIDLNIKADENTEMKDIILKSISYLDKKNYIENTKKMDIEGHLFNYNITDVPERILYNNIQVIEFNKELKMVNIFSPIYENIDNNINNLKEIPFDKIKYTEFIKKRNTTEIILFEKDINSNMDNYIDVYVYPVAEYEKEGMFFNIIKVQKIVSYPIIFSINKNESLKNLQSLIFKKLYKILDSQGRNFLDSIEICFPHFNDKWNNYKIKEGICPICKKAYDKNTKFCALFDSLDKKTTILNLINNQNKNRPLILYGKSILYSPQLSLYRGIPLFFEKKIEIESRANINLYDAFDLLNKEEILEGDNLLYCNNCKGKKKAKKRIEVYKAPYYLILHLKRYKQSTKLGIKNDTIIDYKEALNLKDFVLGPNKEISLYDLYGVVINKKSMNSSHYIAYCKNFGSCLSYDDESVNKIENLIHKDAYLLFYKRKVYE